MVYTPVSHYDPEHPLQIDRQRNKNNGGTYDTDNVFCFTGGGYSITIAGGDKEKEDFFYCQLYGTDSIPGFINRACEVL